MDRKCTYQYGIATDGTFVGEQSECYGDDNSLDTDSNGAMKWDNGSWEITSVYNRTFSTADAASTYLSMMQSGMSDVQTYAEYEPTVGDEYEASQSVDASNSSDDPDDTGAQALATLACAAIIASSVMF
jgi:hypothetical protein